MFLYILIMNYFSGIEWVGFNHTRECTALVDKVFPDYFVLMYAHSGQLKWQMGKGKTITLEAPVAWWTFPGPNFKFGNFDNKTVWGHRFVSFRGERTSSFIQKQLFDMTTPTPYKTVTNAMLFSEKMDELLSYLESPVFGNDRAVYLLEGLLLLLQEDRPYQGISPVEKKVKEIIDQARKQPEINYDFPALAKKLFISYSHFRRIFRLLSGFPPGQFIIRKRMEQAARMLRNTDLEIKQIAAKTGCEDIYYFSKMFKQTYRIPPGRFRKGAVNI